MRPFDAAADAAQDFATSPNLSTYTAILPFYL
jgi:hypothetical protein